MKYLIATVFAASTMFLGAGTASAAPCDNDTPSDSPIQVTAPQASQMTTGSQRDRYSYRNPTFCTTHPYPSANGAQTK